MRYGEPEDVVGKCNARLHIADNFGDNHATMQCQLSPGHEGRHEEVWRSGECKVEWIGDDREEDSAS